MAKTPAFFAGLLFNINPQLNFLVASCSGLVFFILLARLRVSSAPHAMQEAVSGGKVTLFTRRCAAPADALAALLGAGLLRHRHLHLRRL
ncbi:MFS transporter [Klebsiella pneumoniae]|uniref:MFS transporter n=1 Tax=Klebsiella pneumoniae TaxID=573 RepID=UPI003987BC12